MNEEYKAIIDSLIQKQDSIQNLAFRQELGNHTNIIVEQVNQMGFSDWLSILAGIIGVVITIYFGYIALKFSRQQSNQIEELKKVETDIEAQVNRLADINRPFHKTFPEIMSTLQDIFHIAKSFPDKSELFIMNRTSAFGKIHTYNSKFYKQYDLKEPDLRLKQKEILDKNYLLEAEILKDLVNNDDKCKYLFFEDVRKLYELLMECSSKMKKEDLKLIVYNQENQNELVDNFITKYLEEVHTDDDIKSDKGLEYFTYTPRSTVSASSITPAQIVTEKIKEDLSNKEDITNKIINEVIETHNQLIIKIRNNKKDCSEESCWLKYSNEIPMQMYLLKSHRNGQDEYHTFIINAMSTKKGKNPDRYVDGIYSREQSIYDVFKTLFKETFKNNESFKD